MKVSVSLLEDDLKFLDAYARAAGLRSRSAAVHVAIDVLRRHELAASYELAWQDWEDSGEAQAWEAVTADGVVTGAAG
jgi:hypothetical protein